MRRVGFTLVEILMVILVIGILVGLLLPTIAKARESAMAISCAKNMQQTGAAILMYINDNKGNLPRPGGVTASASDAIWWQQARIADIGSNGLGRYLRLSQTELRLFRCPTDSEATGRETTGKYPLTYSINSNFGGDGLQPVRRITQIRSPAEKIYVIEENGPTLDDASVDLWQKSGNWVKVGMLGLRHDRANRKTYPDKATNAGGIVNARGKANVLFADFHVSYTERFEAHSKSRALPNPADPAFATDPERGP